MLAVYFTARHLRLILARRPKAIWRACLPGKFLAWNWTVGFRHIKLPTFLRSFRFWTGFRAGARGSGAGGEAPDDGPPIVQSTHGLCRRAYFEIIQARPGEIPQTWNALDHAATRPSDNDLAAIQSVNNMVNLDNASSALLVHILSAPTPATLNALEVLRGAKLKGVLFSPATEARLAVPAPGAGAH